MKASVAGLSVLEKALPRMAVVAFHGESETDVRDVTRAVLRAELGRDPDPLRVTTLQTSDPAVVGSALQTGTLGGGRPVVWVAEASEKWTPLVDRAIGLGPTGLLLLGFGARFEKSALARLIAANVAGCVVDCSSGASVKEQQIAAVLDALHVSADSSTRRALVGLANGTRQSADTVATAVALLAGKGGRIDESTLAAFRTAGDGAAVTAGVRSALAGDAAALDAAVVQAMLDGQTGVGLLRQALGHLQFARGQSLGFRPDGTSVAALEAKAGALWTAERQAKRTGRPQDLLAMAAVRALGRAR